MLALIEAIVKYIKICLQVHDNIIHKILFTFFFLFCKKNGFILINKCLWNMKARINHYLL